MSLVLLFSTVLLTTPALGQATLVPAGSIWKYLDDGTDQGSAWREPALNDSAWPSGRAQLGYGEGDEATVIGYGPDSRRKHVTTYLRHSFSVSDPSQYRGLKLKVLRDDGAVIYLNNSEIARSNMPSGTVSRLTPASSNVSGADEDTFHDFFVGPDRLVAGTNVLAVEIHQSSRTSSDASFDLELWATGVMRKSPYLIYEGDNTEMKVLWQLNSAGASTIAWGADTFYSAGSAQTSEYGSDHQHVYTITNLTPCARYYYRVVADTNTFRGSFRAAPPADAGRTKFIVYGDSRSYPEDHDWVAGSIVSTCVADSDFQSVIVSVGDLVNNGDQETDWDTELFDADYSQIREMFGTMPYQSVMGNHEQSGLLFSKYFPYPFVNDRYWSFDYGPAHFVMLDQYSDYGPGSPQLDWIESDLASTDKPWKFVCMHEPGWSAGPHANNVIVQDYIQPLCEKYGVAVLFAGHNHYYARAEVNGVEHITAGGGGAPLYPPDTAYPHVVTGTRALHYCKVEIDGDSLELTVAKPGGKVIDHFTLTRTLNGDKPVPYSPRGSR